MFYGWWSWRFVPLLVGSVLFNYFSGLAIAKLNASGRRAAVKGALVFAIAGDLTLLGYFKYADFLLQSWNVVPGSSIPLLHIILQLGISFFTFTQTRSWSTPTAALPASRALSISCCSSPTFPT